MFNDLWFGLTRFIDPEYILCPFAHCWEKRVWRNREYQNRRIIRVFGVRVIQIEVVTGGSK